MNYSAFDADALKERMEKLSFPEFLAFGCSCCERMAPTYLAFQKECKWGDFQAIRSALDYVWNILGKGILPDVASIQKMKEQCEQVIPGSDEWNSLIVTAAQDACFATLILLECLLNQDCGDAVRIARFATDSVDLYVQEIEEMDPQDSNLEDRILNHRLMQQELAQQETELSFIESCNLEDSNWLGQLRSLWKNKGRSNLDLP